MEYFDVKELISEDIPYYVIFGKRSNGKTYSTLRYCLERFFNYNEESVYLRRWKEDIRGGRGSKVFSDFYDSTLISEMSGGKYNGLWFHNRNLYACNYKDNKPIYDSENDRICYFMSLSDIEHDKSTGGYLKVSTIVFDEFLARQGYMTDEFVNFVNALSTVIRGKDNVKVIMLGNTISKFCPYFREMGLSHIWQMKVGTHDIYEYGKSRLKVLVCYTPETQGNIASDFYFAFDNPKLTMITKGEWELPLYPHCTVSFKDRDIAFRYYIIFSGKCFECQVVSKGDNVFTFIFEKTTALRKNILTYSFDISENIHYNSSIYRYRNDKERKLLWFFTHDKVFYSNNEVGNYIDNYLRECKK